MMKNILKIIMILIFVTLPSFKNYALQFQRKDIVPKEQVVPSDCPRGTLTPKINQTIYPNSTFLLLPDSLTGIETVTLENGDEISIKHWGCEYYMLTFCIETSRLKADTTSLKYWYVHSHKILTILNKGIIAPIDIQKGLKALSNYVSRNVFDLKLKTEIDFGDNEIRSFVTIDKIEKVTNKKYAIEITFATGPL